LVHSLHLSRFHLILGNLNKKIKTKFARLNKNNAYRNNFNDIYVDDISPDFRVELAAIPLHTLGMLGRDMRSPTHVIRGTAAGHAQKKYVCHLKND
jgi:hypothetical protein